MGTIGSYHYDDESRARAHRATAFVVGHLANEVQTQGVAFLYHYLDTIIAGVGDELTARGDLSRARDVARSRTLDVDPQH